MTEAIEKRARAVRCWLSHRVEREIVVVTHGAFLHFLTEDWEDGYTLEGQSPTSNRKISADRGRVKQGLGGPMPNIGHL